MAWFKKKKRKKKGAADCEAGGRLRYHIENIQGIGARTGQEDSFTLVNALDEQLYNEYGLMFAVCDGMGGMKDGKTASETAINSFRDCFEKMDRSGKIVEQLRESVFTASKEVEDILDGEGGSTVVIGIILNEKLYFASVGDSYFYLMRDGKLYRLNVEHNVCYQRYLENIRDNIFEPEKCREDVDAAALTQFLGMTGFSEVDCLMRPMPLQKGDILLACSDGVGGVIGKQELIDILNCSEGICQQIEQHIVEHAKPNQDNYTALIIKCK